MYRVILCIALGYFQKSSQWFDKVLSKNNNFSPAITGKAIVLSKQGFRNEA